MLMEDHIMEDHLLMEDPITLTQPSNSAITSTELLVIGSTANSPTDVNTVAGPTLVGTAPRWGSLTSLNCLLGPHYDHLFLNVNHGTTPTESWSDN